MFINRAKNKNEIIEIQSCEAYCMYRTYTMINSHWQKIDVHLWVEKLECSFYVNKMQKYI